MKKQLESLFRLSELNTSVKQEAIGGTTTFMTMSYIIFVQPLVLSAAGMDFGSILVATCISSAIGIVLMAFLANYPVALAPGMGQNFFFTYTVSSVEYGNCMAASTWCCVLGRFNFCDSVIFWFP